MKKNIFIKFLFLFYFVFSFTGFVFAEDISNQEVSGVEISDPDPIPLTENVLIRNGDNTLYNNIVNLPEVGTVDILDNNGVSHQVDSRSVLGLLSLIDQNDDSFSISNLVYYDSFGSFYLKCITSSGIEHCDNWQYVVGGATPSSGIDQTILFGGESVGLYFGTPHKLILDKNEITEGNSITVNSLKYNYLDNTWGVLSGINIVVTIPNEADPWNPTIISEYPVDENGQVLITLNTEGVYTFGIKEDYSFPSYQVTVTKTSSGNGGIGGSTTSNFSISNAVDFLSLNNNIFSNNSLYQDWVAIGIAQVGNGASSLRNQVYDSVKNNNFESASVTDDERHAMALMALGINPYNGTDVNYIKKITDSFDRTQIGDSSLFNDDIFALIVLSHAGYTKDDEIIKKVTGYIISHQSNDGSWGSVDMTGAGIQALSNFKSLDGVDNSISKAKDYLSGMQNEDGGFDNIFSTSWAIQALSLDNSFNTEVDKAIGYLADNQLNDGGINQENIESRVWGTAYVIPAVLKLSWNDILMSFEKEESSVQTQEDEVVNQEEEKIEIPNIKNEEIIPTINKEIKEISKRDIKKAEIKKPNEEIIPTNVLSASVIGASSNTINSESMIFKVVNAVKASFFWLWELWVKLFSLI